MQCYLFILIIVPMVLGTRCPGQLEECNSSFDAVTRTSDGGTYAFAGSIVYKFFTYGVGPQWPQLISDAFPGLPNDVDAALYNWNANGKTYFFKGDQYWRFSGTVLDNGYPGRLSAWGGVPHGIDAAMVWNYNGRTYFFKGDVYYRYNDGSNHVDSGYPASVDNWDSRLRGNIKAAFQARDGSQYFFGEKNFFKYNDRSSAIEDGFPLSTAKYWLSCSHTCQCTCHCDHEV